MSAFQLFSVWSVVSGPVASSGLRISSLTPVATKLRLALLLAVLPMNASAASYYVVTDGKAGNDGSQEKPFPSVEAALAKVGGGQTIILKPGIYRGPMLIDKAYAGTKAHPTVIKSELKWKAVIAGAPYHVIDNLADWVVVDGFEVLGARYVGIKMEADHDTVANCWVHNNSLGGVAMHNRAGGLIENNLVEFNGSHVQFHHGIYADGDGLSIRGNIVRHNAGFGLHLYPSLRNSVIACNLVYGHASKPGIIVVCPDGGGRNVIVNNTVAENDGALAIWHGNGEVVVNNILLAGRNAISLAQQTTNVLVDYNLCTQTEDRQGAHAITGDPKFVDAGRGVFWLKPESAAIGKGTPEYAPATDFWGRPVAKDRPPDVGAFAFVPALATEQARVGWYYNWAYRFAPASGRDMPDLWALPTWKP